MVRNHIYLIGLMGAGKTTVGRLLAQRLGRELADTDAAVAAAAGRSIPEIFAAEGEAGFRDREEAALAQLARRQELVVATGGGIVLREANRARMRASGVVIYLQAEPEELYRRLARGGIRSRPLLQGPDPLGTLRRLLAERDPLYRAVAHHVLPSPAAGGPADMAERIARLLAGPDAQESEEDSDGRPGPG